MHFRPITAPDIQYPCENPAEKGLKVGSFWLRRLL